MSGGNNERPELEAAIKLCRKTNSSLVVAKVDRLSRDVEFVAKLLKDKNLKIRVANIPNADNFTIHLFDSEVYFAGKIIVENISD